MKISVKAALLIAGVCTSGLVWGQQNSSDDRYDRTNRRDDDSRYDTRTDERRSDSRRADRQYDERDLSRAYDEGFDDGQRSQNDRRNQDNNDPQEHSRHYKYLTFGVYGGANSTNFQGETVDSKNLTGRLGYQLGFFVRGGGRIYGQVGAEYLTSSSNFYKPGDGTSVKDITSNIDQRYLHIPAYIGVKLAQSERGVSGIRLQLGAEYATPLSTDKNDFNLNNADFQAATINGLAGLGFDAGPIMLDFVYHYGFADVLASGNSKRRILGVNLGFKF